VTEGFAGVRVTRWTLLYIVFFVLLAIGWATEISAVLREGRGAETPIVIAQWRLVALTLPLLVAGAVFMALIYHAWFLSSWFLSPTRLLPTLRVPLLIFWGFGVIGYAIAAVEWVLLLFGRG